MASPTDRLRFSWKTLAPIAEAHAQTYAAGEPFPHIVIDGLVPELILRRAVAAFPEPGALDWQRFQNPRERKLATHVGHIVQLPDAVLHILNEFNHVVFVRFLEMLTGIEGLMPDHTFVGGGLHQIESGGLHRRPHLGLARDGGKDRAHGRGPGDRE